MAHAALECRDFPRADVRIDAEDRARFLEMDPLPNFAPDGCLGILAQIEGRPLADRLVEGAAAGWSGSDSVEGGG